ncbi:GntR family transcriptional regulator [Micromonospora matsumotoense]|uniref:GntR family transcriptional regulator n=1 Tax=Micromonospora matsumotoense TaxID=121616 RepID=UPI0033E4BF87
MPTPHYGQPRYRTIADELRKRIESGAISPGALLPTESALTAEFRVSRGTIRQAIAALREIGFVTTEHGRGTHANARFYDHNMSDSATQQTRQREVPANEELAVLFGVDIGTTLVVEESITRRSQRIESVTRTYRIRTASH